MRLSHVSAEDPERVHPDSMVANQDRRCRVRMSILSRELILLVVLVGVAGSMTGVLRDGRSVQRFDRSSLRGHDSLVTTVVYSADGRTLVSCGWDKQVRLWEVGEGQLGWGTEIRTLPHDWHVYSIAMTPDCRYIATCGVGGFTIWCSKPDSGWEKVKENTGLSYRSLAISPDGRTLALVCSDGTIRLWDLAAMTANRVLRGVTGELKAVGFSSDGALLAASTFGGDLCLWDVTSQDQQPIKTGIPDSVQSFAFLPGSRNLAIAQSSQDCARALPLGPQERLAAIADL